MDLRLKTNTKKSLSLQQQWTKLQQSHPQMMKKKKKKKKSYCSSTDKQLTAQFSLPQLFLFKDPSRVCNSLSIVMQLWWGVTLLRACRGAMYTDCGLTVIAPALLSPPMLANVTAACCTNLTQWLQPAARRTLIKYLPRLLDCTVSSQIF